MYLASSLFVILRTFQTLLVNGAIIIHVKHFTRFTPRTYDVNCVQIRNTLRAIKHLNTCHGRGLKHQNHFNLTARIYMRKAKNLSVANPGLQMQSFRI